jgi:hypothetical protein
VAGYRDGVDPDEFGPFRGALAVATFAAIVGFALYLAPFPALVTALIAGGAAYRYVRHVRRSRRIPDRWEDWYAAGFELSDRAVFLQLAFFAFCLGIATLASSQAVKASAIALLGAPCLVFATNGFRLLIDYRRRRRAGIVDADLGL